ncbi:CBS domain-containing protein [Arcticibacter sp. MXS-1]|uniref:CBS domain-containing protein n=1 Tax=Arcticibacter sp. MXS-1 TaxID=3341726 RepID=UPI0035A8B399
MKTVKDILANKPSGVYSIPPQASVFDALNVMMDKNISALLIIENDELLGIFTERDYARKVILKGRASKETAVSDVMTARPLTVSLTDNIDHCMNTMTEKHIRHLPVLSSMKVVGMVSIGDVVKSIIEMQKETIKHLESYINS